MDFILPAIIVGGILFGGTSAFVATQKNRDPFAWFMIGAVFGIFGLVAALASNRIDAKQPAVAGDIPVAVASDGKALGIFLAVGVILVAFLGLAAI